MSDQKLTVSMILNSSSFQKKIQDVNKQIKLSESEFAKVSSSTKGFGTSLDGAKSKLENVTKKLDLQGKKVSTYKEEISKTQKTLGELTAKHGEQSKKLDEVKKKYEATCSTMGKNSEEAKSLKEEVDKLEKSKKTLETRIVSTNSRLTTLQTELNKSETDFNKLEDEVKDAEKALKNFNTDAAKKKLNELGESLQQSGDKIAKVGDGFDKAGSVILKATAPFVGAGVAAAKVGIDFEDAMAKVQSVSGATGEQLNQLKETAEYWGKSTKFSASESAEAMYYMGLAGWKSEQMINGIGGVLNLAAAGAVGLGEASDIVTDGLTSLGMGAEQSERLVDVMAATITNSNTDVAMMGETFKYAASLGGALGYTCEDISLAIGLMANAGIKASQAGTSLRKFFAETTGGAKVVGKAFESATNKQGLFWIETQNADGSMRKLKDILVDLRNAFSQLTEAEKAANAESIAGKTGMAGLLAMVNATEEDFNKLANAIDNSNGKAAEMAEIMSKTTKGKMTQLKSALEGVCIQLADIMIPVINDVVNKISEWVQKFSELSPETKEMIIKMTMFAAGAGVTTKAVGKLTKGVGGTIKTIGAITKLIGGSGGAATAFTTLAGSAGTATSAVAGAGGLAAGAGGLAASLGAVASAALPVVAAVGAVGVTAYAAHKALTKEVVPAVDLFADKVVQTKEAVYDANGMIVQSAEYTTTKISEQTEKAVGAYMEMDDGVRSTIYGLYTSSTTVTKEMTEQIKAQIGEMGTTIKENLKTDCEETTKNLGEFFAGSKALSEKTEADILQKTNEYYTQKQKDVEFFENQINDILSTASKEKRELTQDEYETITNCMNQMRTESVKALSEQEVESQVILERMKSYDERMTTEMASEHIKQLNEQKDKAVKAANEECDEVVRNVTRMRDEAKTISADQAEKLIADAQKQRDETIKAAEETRKGAISKMEQLNKDLTKSVNTTTGEIKTAWDKMKDAWDNWWPKTKNFVANIFTREKKGEPPKDAKSMPANGQRMINTPDLASYADNYNDVALARASFADSLYVPSAYEVAAEMRAIGVMPMGSANVGSVQNSSNSGSDFELVSILQSQNQLLTQMVGLLSKNNQASVAVQLDGKTIAKASAKYMNTEIENLNRRRTRLGGAF